MRIFFNIYRNILLVVAILLAAVMILPLAFQVKPYIVLSGSMEPTISAGDVCYIMPYKENEKPEINDVVAFKFEDDATMFVHRIVGIKNEKYITQGDANEAVDLQTSSAEMVVGQAVFIIPYLGTVVSWLQSTTGIITMIVAVLISILSSFLDDKKKDGEKKTRKEKKRKKNVVELEEIKEVQDASFSPSLSALIKKQKDEIPLELNAEDDWSDDFLNDDFEKIPDFNYSSSEDENIFDEGHNDQTQDLQINDETNIEHDNETQDNEFVEEADVFDFDNLSVEDETKKVVEKYTANLLTEVEPDEDTSYEKLSMIGLNNIADDVESEDLQDVDELLDVASYTDKYLGNEAEGITEDSPLFETEGVALDINKWSFMVDDESEDSIFTEKYKESVMNSVKRKLDSETYNDADNFSPAAILKRAQDAMIDDLSEEEEEIIKLIMQDAETDDIE